MLGKGDIIMTLTREQRFGVILAAVSLTIFAAIMIVYTLSPFCPLLVIAIGIIPLLLVILGIVMATSNSEEPMTSRFARYCAALGGYPVPSREQSEEAEKRRTAIDPDDRDRIDRL